MLLPRLIAALDIALRDKLTPTYVCTIEVGGAYAHLFRKLIEFLQLPALVITDLDSIDDTTKKKASVASGYVSSNATLSQWFPGNSDLPVLMAADEAQKTSGRVRVAYQVPEAVGQLCARSFEEAFVHVNAVWPIANKAKMLAIGETFTHVDATALTAGAYNVSLPKINLVLDLLANEGWAIPMYTREGLEWLVKQ